MNTPFSDLMDEVFRLRGEVAERELLIARKLTAMARIANGAKAKSPSPLDTGKMLPTTSKMVSQFLGTVNGDTFSGVAATTYISQTWPEVGSKRQLVNVVLSQMTARGNLDRVGKGLYKNKQNGHSHH